MLLTLVLGQFYLRGRAHPPNSIHATFFPQAQFSSQKLNYSSKTYDVGNKELLAIKAALEEWRHWLEAAKYEFSVITDHEYI